MKTRFSSRCYMRQINPLNFCRNPGFPRISVNGADTYSYPMFADFSRSESKICLWCGDWTWSTRGLCQSLLLSVLHVSELLQSYTYLQFWLIKSMVNMANHVLSYLIPCIQLIPCLVCFILCMQCLLSWQPAYENLTVRMLIVIIMLIHAYIVCVFVLYIWNLIIQDGHI